MKTMSLRGLARKAPEITEDTLITFQGKVIGTYKPNWGALQFDDPLLSPEQFREIQKEASMDEPIKKAIETERAKPSANPNKLSKGLGEVPGLTDKSPTVDPYHAFRPAPKPGTKK